MRMRKIRKKKRLFTFRLSSVFFFFSNSIVPDKCENRKILYLYDCNSQCESYFIFQNIFTGYLYIYSEWNFFCTDIKKNTHIHK